MWFSRDGDSATHRMFEEGSMRFMRFCTPATLDSVRASTVGLQACGWRWGFSRFRVATFPWARNPKPFATRRQDMRPSALVACGVAAAKMPNEKKCPAVAAMGA